MVFHTRLLQSSKKDIAFRSCLLECQSLFQSKGQHQPKTPRLDVFSMHCVSIVLDMVQRSQYLQDFHDLCLLMGKKNTVCFLLES